MKISRLGTILIAVLSTPQFALAKRGVPKPLPALVNGGVKYIAPAVMPNYSSIYGVSTCPAQSMCVEARTKKSGKLLWQVEVYKIRYDPNLEQDVQDIFISSLAIDRGKLVVRNEGGATFIIDLKTRSVLKK